MDERLGEIRKGRRERIEKGSHCFFKSLGYDKLELNHKLKANRTSETEEQRKERLRIRREKDRARRRTK